MLYLPEEPAGGDYIAASWGKKVVRYLRAITPQSSPDVRVKSTANGTTFDINKGRIGGAAETPCEAFAINITEVASPDFTVLLTPGTVNSAVPSNILTPIAYNSTTDRYVKLKCTSDGYAITGVTVALEASPSDPISTSQNAGPTSFDILIGVISQGVKTQVWSDCNITATLTLALIESKASPTPGVSPYNFYYTWVVTGH